MKNMHFLVPESKCISYIQFILYVYFLLRASITKRKTQNKEKLPEKLRRYAPTKQNQEKTDKIIAIINIVDM